MKKMTSSLFLSAALLCLSALSLRAAEFSSTDGVVEVKKTGATVWTHAKVKAPIVTGDVIRTGAGAKVEVTMDEGHKISLKEKTTARVESAAKGDTRFFLEIGKLKAKVNKLGKGNKFEIRTPLAVASVRGTVFEVEVAEDLSSKLSVLEGKVGYKELSGLGRDTLVPAGQTLIYTPPAPKGGSNPGDKPTPPAPKPADGDKTEKTPDPAAVTTVASVATVAPVAAVTTVDTSKDSTAVLAPVTLANATLVTSASSLLTASINTDAFKQEVLAETTISLSKDLLQTDVVQTVQQEQVQTGRALVDRLGRRVRYEEYLTRPTANSFSQTMISQRDTRVDTARYDVYAANALPKDLSGLNLLRSPDGSKLSNWMTGSEYVVTNQDGQYYRELTVGGKPVTFTEADGKTPFQQSVFTDMYVEASGDGKTALLLAHWVPDPTFSKGSYFATQARDALDVYGVDLINGKGGTGDGGQDLPNGYVNFDADGKGVIGDVLGSVPKLTVSDRMLFFDPSSGAKIQSIYAGGEGEVRTVTALMNGKPVSINGTSESAGQTSLAGLRNKSTTFSLLSTYTSAKGVVTTLQVDGSYVGDDGTMYPYGKIGDSLVGFTGVNRELDYTGSIFGKGDIDVEMGPEGLRPVDKEDTPSVSAPLP